MLNHYFLEGRDGWCVSPGSPFLLQKSQLPFRVPTGFTWAETPRSPKAAPPEYPNQVYSGPAGTKVSRSEWACSSSPQRHMAGDGGGGATSKENQLLLLRPGGFYLVTRVEPMGREPTGLRGGGGGKGLQAAAD